MQTSSASAVATDAPRKNKIHSILTALPVLMLVVGLYYFYSGESAQNSGSPILDESIDADVVFDGMSVVRSGGEGRHYLWYDDGTRRRGARIHARQVPAVASLRPGDRIAVRLAPTVSGSSVLWAWRVERDQIVLIDTLQTEH